MEGLAGSYVWMLQRLETLEKYGSGNFRRETAGVTADGREIPAISLGNETGPVHILIHAAIHGREYMNTLLVMAQMEDYLRGLRGDGFCRKSSGKFFADMRRTDRYYEEVCFHVVPMANPDGVAISQEGADGIRDPSLKEFLLGRFQKEGRLFHPMEYFRIWKANARGVDLNRNFDAGWEEYAGAAFPCAEGYRGSAPGSENEVTALLGIADRYPIQACISYHSSGNLIYWDYRSTAELHKKEQELAWKLAETTGYRLCSASQEGLDRAGCSDYFTEKREIPAVTIETGISACPLPEEEFAGIYSRNSCVWEAAASVLL